MGVAYLAQVAGVMLTGGNAADALDRRPKRIKSLRTHALELNPDHAEALATHGGVQALMASFQKAPQQAAKGVADMNRAVELAPHSVRVRLVRAFNGLSLPDPLRNHEAEAEDLDFLIKVAGTPARETTCISCGETSISNGAIPILQGTNMKLRSSQHRRPQTEAQAPFDRADSGRGCNNRHQEVAEVPQGPTAQCATANERYERGCGD